MKRLAIATIMLALAHCGARAIQGARPDNEQSRSQHSAANGRAAGKNLIGAAEEMPADKYGYRPTPEQITFAHLVMHSAQANNAFCAGIAGEPAREIS